MARRKNTGSPAQSAESCVDRLKIVADSTRLAVLEALMDGPQQVMELSESLQVEQSLLSHHLKLLRDAGLVKGQRVGKAVRYQLAPGIVITKPTRAIRLGCCDISFAPASGPKPSA